MEEVRRRTVRGRRRIHRGPNLTNESSVKEKCVTCLVLQMTMNVCLGVFRQRNLTFLVIAGLVTLNTKYLQTEIKWNFYLHRLHPAGLNEDLSPLMLLENVFHDPARVLLPAGITPTGCRPAYIETLVGIYH